jgi:UDP-N-acetyl-D-mannosaminuronic acid dehydrogenase
MVDVAIVGGCGHVGLPLGLAFADRGLCVELVDADAGKCQQVNRGKVPFAEPNADCVLARMLDAGRIRATTDPLAVAQAESVVVVIGTPIHEHHNPDLNAVQATISEIGKSLVDDQLLVLRSTVYPGVTAMVERLVERLGKDIDVAFCPERVAEGQAMTELCELPQIVASRSPRALDRATKLFRTLTHEIVFLDPEKAELAKLFTNTWRYINFATANQLNMMANDFGFDYERIRAAVTYKYPRAADLPSAGFAAGPCLFKDTMQRYDLSNLSNMTVGIRSSLSYKLRRILRFKAKEVLCHDPYVTSDPDLTSLEEVLASADLLVIATPHGQYTDVQTNLPVIDIWNLREDGVRI